MSIRVSLVAILAITFLLIALISIIIILVMSNNNKSDLGVEVVIARYEEDMSKFAGDAFRGMRLTVYNKGISEVYPCISLPNVGRCDHTYLYHIVANYDNLADVTVFLPASCFDGPKSCNTRMVLDAVRRTGSSVFPKAGDVTDVRNNYYHFKLSEWSATNEKNKALNPEIRLAPSPIQPFGAWFDWNFPGLPPIGVICYYGIFAVSKEHIMQHPRDRYERLLHYLDENSNPEAGHYMERAWGALFYPYPSRCIHSVPNCSI